MLCGCGPNKTESPIFTLLCVLCFQRQRFRILFLGYYIYVFAHNPSPIYFLFTEDAFFKRFLLLTFSLVSRPHLYFSAVLRIYLFSMPLRNPYADRKGMCSWNCVGIRGNVYAYVKGLIPRPFYCSVPRRYIYCSCSSFYSFYFHWWATHYGGF